MHHTCILPESNSIDLEYTRKYFRKDIPPREPPLHPLAANPVVSLRCETYWKRNSICWKVQGFLSEIRQPVP